MATPEVVTQAVQWRERVQTRELFASRAMADRYLHMTQTMMADFEALAEQVTRMAAAGEEVALGKLYQLERYQRMAIKMDAELQDFRAYAEGIIREEQRYLLTAGAQAAKDELRAAGGGAPGAWTELGGTTAAIEGFPTAAIEQMVGQTSGGPLQELLIKATDSDAASRDIGRLLSSSVGLGHNAEVIAAQMAAQFGLPLARALCIARTETNSAYRASSLEGYKQGGVAEYQRLSARDSVVCAGCAAADGERYTVFEEFEDHPNCRCTCLPVVGPGIAEFPMGEDWFKTLPEEDQRAILGGTRYDMWKSGDVKFEQFATRTGNEKWGNAVVETPIKELKAGGGGLKALASGPTPPYVLPEGATVAYADVLNLQSLRSEVGGRLGGWDGGAYAQSALDALTEAAATGGEAAGRMGAVVIRGADGRIKGLANFTVPDVAEAGELASIGERVSLWLDYMGVEVKGSGAGTDIMRAVAQEAAKRDFGVLTQAHGTSAGFYERLGMSSIRMRGGALQYEWTPEQAKAFAQAVTRAVATGREAELATYWADMRAQAAARAVATESSSQAAARIEATRLQAAKEWAPHGTYPEAKSWAYKQGCRMSEAAGPDWSAEQVINWANTVNRAIAELRLAAERAATKAEKHALSKAVPKRVHVNSRAEYEESIKKWGENMRQASAYASKNDMAVCFNPQYPFGISRSQAVDWATRDYPAFVFDSTSMGTVRHEFGHLVSYDASVWRSGKAWTFRDWPALTHYNQETKKLIEGWSGNGPLGPPPGLSIYGQTNPKEFMAEVWSALCRGDRVSKDCMDLYRALHMPVPGPGYVVEHPY